MGGLGLIRRNSIFTLLAIATRLLTNALLFIGVARYYGAVEFGQFALAHVYFSILLLAADFGYDFFLATEIGRDEGAGLAVAGRIFPLKVLFSAAAAVLMIVLALGVRPGGAGAWLMILMAAAIPANALMLYGAAILRGSQDLLPEAKATFIQNALLLVLLVGIGALGMPFPAVVAAFSASRVIGMALMLRAVRRHYPLLAFGFSSLRGPGLKALLAVGATFGVHMICSSLYFQIDTILLDRLAGGSAVALYQSAVKLAMIVLIVNDVANITLVPVLARAYEEHHQRWARLGGLVSKSLWLFGGLAGMVFLLCGPELLDAVYGKGMFTEASGVMRTFGMVLMVRFAMEPYGIMLTTANMQRQRTIVVLSATVLNLLANLAVIPAAGIGGAAWVALGTNVFVAIAYVSILSVRLGRPFPLNRRGDASIPLLFGAIGVTFRIWNISSLAVVVPVLCAAAATLLFLSFSTDEQRTVAALFGLRSAPAVKSI